MYYLDTNIFIYRVDKQSPYWSSCKKLLNLKRAGNTKFVTSTETIQEIIHYCILQKKTDVGLRIAHDVINAVDVIIPINIEIVDTYLALVKQYQKEKRLQSRDYIHAATCIVNKLDGMISYDQALNKIYEIKVLTAEQYLRFKTN